MFHLFYLSRNFDQGAIDVLAQVVIFLSGAQFCIFFSKPVRDIDLILFVS